MKTVQDCLITKGRIVLLCLAFSIALCPAANADAKLRADDSQAFSQDMFPTIWEGMRAAASAIRTGRSEVRVREWIQRNEGGVLETNTKYEVVFTGKLFKVTTSSTIIQNTPDRGEESQLMTPPGTEFKRIVSFDGNKVVAYSPDSGEATISDPAVGDGLNEIRVYNADASVFGHGFISAKLADPLPPTNIRVVGRETIDGDECFVLEVRDGYESISSRRRIWVNPSKGYIIVRAKSWLQEGSNPEFMNYEVNRTVREYAPGIWGPAVDTEIDYIPDRVTGSLRKNREVTTTFDQGFQVNVAVGKEDISLTLPSGTRVRDNIANAKYTVR